MSVPHGTQVAHSHRLGNQLLDALSSGVRGGMLAEARWVSLAHEESLYVPGERVRRLYFPVTAVCSLLVGLRSGQRAEVATIGNEGAAGLQAVLGTRPVEQAMVQVAGEAIAVDAQHVRRCAEAHRSLRDALRRYTAYSWDMAKQSVVCNAYHPIDERLPRWLLIARDRAHADEFRGSHELFSLMVAATRPRVGEAMVRLKAARLIEYDRGFIRILDRKGLEARSCECYAAMKRWADRAG